MSEKHPTRPQIELAFLGESTVCIRQHIERCKPCQLALEELKSAQAARNKRVAPEKAIQLAMAEQQARHHRWAKYQSTWTVGCALSCAAAVAVLIQVEHTSPAPVESREMLTASEFLGPDVLTAKGSQPLSVVRHRGQEQKILTGNVPVLPGDKLRLRFEIRTAQHIVAGLITDQGNWIPLFEDFFSHGIHVPKTTLDIDSKPGAGVIVIGGPRDVELLRDAVENKARGQRHNDNEDEGANRNVNEALGRVSTLKLVWRAEPE